MKIISIVAGVFVILSGVLAYLLVTTAMQNDGLTQTMKSDRQSIRDLLAYISTNSACDVTPQDVANALHRSQGERVEVFSDGEGSQEVASLTFRAKFTNGRISRVGILDVEEVRVCD